MPEWSRFGQVSDENRARIEEEHRRDLMDQAEMGRRARRARGDRKSWFRRTVARVRRRAG